MGTVLVVLKLSLNPQLPPDPLSARPVMMNFSGLSEPANLLAKKNARRPDLSGQRLFFAFFY
jgi:hypothetical protein